MYEFEKNVDNCYPEKEIPLYNIIILSAFENSISISEGKMNNDIHFSHLTTTKVLIFFLMHPTHDRPICRIVC